MRPAFFILSLVLPLLGACGEQRVVLFQADGGSDAAVDATGDTAVVDVGDRDPENCGASEEHCEDDEYCVLGLCECRQSLVRVGEDCIDLASDPEHCGTEGNVCPSLCQDGACVTSCTAGATECEGACVDMASHPTHCGECERPCGSGRVCVAGSCESFRPAACTTCPCGLCGTRSCCAYPSTPDPICVDSPSCPLGF